MDVGSIDRILCQRTFLRPVRIQKSCRAVSGTHHEVDVQHLSGKVQWLLPRVSCKQKIRCWILRTGDLTRFSANPMPEVPSGVDMVHNLSAHIPLTSTPRGSRDELRNTPSSSLEVQVRREVFP